MARPVRAPSAEAAAREEIWECSDGSSRLRIALFLLALIADTSGRAHPRETAFSVLQLRCGFLFRGSPQLAAILKTLGARKK
jgi:hypothetical protein